MKRQFTKVPHTRIELEIIAVLNDDLFSVAASVSSDKLHWRDLPAEYQLTTQQFETYRNLISSIVSAIRAYGFDIVDEYQSNLSYSYYIQFTPTPYKGFEDEMLELDVKFRISNYEESKKITKNITKTTSTGKPVTFKSIIVSGFEHANIAEALLDIKHICQDLKCGDYSAFIE